MDARSRWVVRLFVVAGLSAFAVWANAKGLLSLETIDLFDIGTTRRAHAPVKTPPRQISLRAPKLESWRPIHQSVEPRPITSYLRHHSSDLPLSALALELNTPVYDRIEWPRSVIGRVRWGNVLPAAEIDGNPSCTNGSVNGRWYRTPSGVLCSARQFEVVPENVEIGMHHAHADVRRPLPFRYARVIEQDAPRFRALPTAEDLRAIAAAKAEGNALPDIVLEEMRGDFFLALAYPEEQDGVRYWRTVAGEYARADDLDIRDTPPFRGVELGSRWTLPIGFVWGAGPATVYCDAAEAPEPCGTAERHARFPTSRVIERAGARFIETRGGLLLPADRVRLVETRERPRGVPPDAKWVHIELSQQAMVAYEGDTPVYATLITSGKPGHDTPTGLYRTDRKYLSTLMRGPDPDSGLYHVEEVPWTMFYNRGYAVHGAYWHNDFGKTRSHGCTNVAPADARWLFYWGSLQLPSGWNGRFDELGTWFYFTRS